MSTDASIGISSAVKLVFDDLKIQFRKRLTPAQRKKITSNTKFMQMLCEFGFLQFELFLEFFNMRKEE